MRILLVSDSHGNNEAIDELIARWPDVDLYLHAGDSETHPRSIYPFRVVRGNCDYNYEDLPEELIIPMPFGKMMITHKKDVPAKRLKKEKIKLLIYGHTHIPECIKEGDIALINPGSLAYPRSKYDETYMILEVNKFNIDVFLRSFENDKLLKRFKVQLVEGEAKPQVDLDVEEPEEEKPEGEENENEEELLEEEEQELTDEELKELERQIDEIEREIAEIRSRKKL